MQTEAIHQLFRKLKIGHNQKDMIINLFLKNQLYLQRVCNLWKETTVNKKFSPLQKIESKHIVEKAKSWEHQNLSHWCVALWTKEVIQSLRLPKHISNHRKNCLVKFLLLKIKLKKLNKSNSMKNPNVRFHHKDKALMNNKRKS